MPAHRAPRPRHPQRTRIAPLVAAAALALLATTIALPTASPQTVTFDTVTVTLGPSVFDAALEDQAIEDDNAESLRRYVDEQYGDSDGIVTEAEYEAYRQAEIERFNEQLDNPIARGLFADIKVNGGSARGLEVTDVTLTQNVVGSTADNDTIQRSVFARLAFAGTEKSRVNVSFEQDFRVPFRLIEMEWRIAHFVAMEGWSIEETSANRDTVVTKFWVEDRFIVPYDATGDFSSRDHPLWFDIVDPNGGQTTKSSGEKKGSPGPSVAAALMGVVALVGLLRTRSMRRG